MTYLKDQLTGACRKFDENKPKEARKIKVFMKAKLYNYDGDDKKTTAYGGRWQKTTKKAYDAWVKHSPIEVESVEVE